MPHTNKDLKIRCFDNWGETADRYTVIYLELPEGRGEFQCVGMSSYPFHPQGVGLHGSALPGPHLGDEIEFEQLPEDCRRLVLQDLELDEEC